MKSINKKKNSNATEVLHTIKTYNNRFFIMWLITFISLVISLFYNIYLLNDRSIIETTETQEIEKETDEGNNYYIGRDGDING